MNNGRTKAVHWLNSCRQEDGKWGYVPGQKGRCEPTLFAMLAGMEGDLDWLRQSKKGWWTFLIPALLARTPNSDDIRKDAIQYIIESRPPELRCWSWVANTHSWMEPTSYAVLSLKMSGLQSHQLVQDAVADILDRQSYDGGWNVGVVEIFGTPLSAHLPPTGWAALALQGDQVPHQALNLLLQARQKSSPLTLSLAILAR
ncbi:MAG: terpene cyclase/mutase family protein, partial [Proteobacteria bacterium]|nr:terpene cyclase/mutase family protein [Pseudomonadota bacterium]